MFWWAILGIVISYGEKELDLGTQYVVDVDSQHLLVFNGRKCSLEKEKVDQPFFLDPTSFCTTATL